MTATASNNNGHIDYSITGGDDVESSDQPRQSQWIRKTLTPTNVYLLLQVYTYIDNIQSPLQLTISQLHELLSDCITAFYGSISAAKYGVHIVASVQSQFICQCSANSLIAIRAAMALCGDYRGRVCRIDVVGCSTTLIGLTHLVKR